ncbi:MAG: kinase, partial [Pseudomonadales bacterium]|nr:kinase [Pseudomonadales bacterium]
MTAFESVIEDIARWLENRRPAKDVMCLGIAGAQGSGKTTLATELADHMNRQGLTTCTLSLDDFYRTRAEREALARELHPLFRTRGVPGSHDMKLMLEAMRSLQQGNETQVPVFDKAADDRCRDWRTIPAGQEFVIIEGWCWGARPASGEDLLDPINELEAKRDPDGTWRKAVNSFLAEDGYQRAFAATDALLFLVVPDFDAVFRWRLQQEQELSPGEVNRVMDDAGVREFIMHYERISRRMLRDLPGRADISLRL